MCAPVLCIETPAPEDEGGDPPSVDTTAPLTPGRPSQSGPGFWEGLGPRQVPAEHENPKHVSDFEVLVFSYLEMS